jgi:hypothetical protein
MKRFLTLLLAVIVLLPGLSQAQQVTDVNLPLPAHRLIPFQLQIFRL